MRIYLPAEWVERAEFFRREARRLLEEGVYWASCFAAQQAVELYLKAFQVALTGVHVFTHDLSRLLYTLEEAGVAVPGELYPLADALTPHYTLARYPGSKTLTYDSRIASRCVDYMERILGWLKDAAGDPP